MERHPSNVPPASVSTRMSMSSSTLSSMLDSVPTGHAQGNGSFGRGGGTSHPVPSSSTATAGGTDVRSSSSTTVHVPATSTNPTSDFVDTSSAQPTTALITTLDASSPSHSKPKEVFEFTKRKRWADLLITELTEAIILVLSMDGIVWYCGNAVHDLLGWRDDEVIDREFLDIMNVDDRPRFQSMFRESIEQKSELLSYARLQCKPTEPFLITAASSAVGEFTSPPSKEILFEIKGYPHFLPDTDEFKCFFAVAKPYPSRNTAMLNTFLELKIENERLQERLSNLKIRKASLTSTSSSGEPSGSSSLSSVLTASTSQFLPRTSQYSHLYPQESSQGIIPPPLPNGELPPNANFYGGTYGDLLPSPVNVCFDTPSTFGQCPGPVQGGGEEEGPSAAGTTGAGDGPSLRKKMKKVYTAEQYVCVTCGRTDSPEWRKGPTGPKTLCNACGLRWAKRVRTNKGEEAGTGKNSG